MVEQSELGSTDLNGEGDGADLALHVHDIATGITTNVGLAGGTGIPGCAGSVQVSGRNLSFPACEPLEGAHSDGDGDMLDGAFAWPESARERLPAGTVPEPVASRARRFLDRS